MSAPVTARLPLPHLLERGRDTLIECPLYRSGALVTVTSGTVEVRTPTNEDLGGNVVVTDGAATFTVAGTDTEDLTPGDAGWLVTWTLTASGYSEPVVVRSTAALVRSRLRPVIAAVDLYRRVPALDPSARATIVRDDPGTRHQDVIDESWLEIEHRLLANGNRPWLVLSPWVLRQAHLHLALSYVFADLAARVANPELADRATQARADYEAAWDAVSLTYDYNDDDAPDDEKKSASASVWLL